MTMTTTAPLPEPMTKQMHKITRNALINAWDALIAVVPEKERSEFARCQEAG